MKRIQKARLRFTEGNTDKIYEIDLCKIFGIGKETYVVNYRYGKYGSKLREGSRTPSPVTLEKAQKIYDSIVVSKLNDGYVDMDQPRATEASPSSSDKHTSTSEITSRILTYLQAPPSHWPLSRIIWRAGELRIPEAADHIANIKSTGEITMEYSMAWSLGRCGNKNHLPALSSLLRSDSSAVKRMAREAWLTLAPQAEREVFLRKILKGLPVEVQHCIKTNDSDNLAKRLLSTLSENKGKSANLLEDIYSLAFSSPSCHRALLQVLQTIPIQEANYFQTVRHLFKISEFRLDSSIFSLLALRFELTRACGWNRPFQTGTREYLRKRIWRTLHRLGEAGSDRYVEMAAAILSTYSDDHARQPREVIHSHWDYDRRQYVVTSERYHDTFSDYLALNHILYGRSSQYRKLPSGKAWYRSSTTIDTGRTESFPELWDRSPETVVHLLIDSRCSIVHNFGITMLQDHQEFCETLPKEDLVQLLHQGYEATGDFALELIRSRYNPAEPDSLLLDGCLRAPHPAAREAAVQWIGEQPELLKEYPDLLIASLTNPEPEIRQWAATLLPNLSFTPLESSVVVARIVGRLKELDSETSTETVKEVTSLLLNHFKETLQELDISEIAELLHSPKPSLQLLGARLLLNLTIDIEDIPPEFLDIISQSENMEVQAIGVSLLGKHSDVYLLDQEELLLSYCTSEAPEIRAAVNPIIARLARENEDFGQRFLQHIITFLFTAEKSEGEHDSLITLATTALPYEKIEKNLRWRLLHARSKGAQRMGALCLKKAPYEDYTIRQWAALANNPTRKVRQWSMDAYTADPDRIRQKPADGLRILNSKWQESREFGVDFFRQHFTEQDWSPTIIIGICDSNQDDIQRFGRELITDFFEEGHGLEYLIKLSQHPSRNVQLFTTNYLTGYADSLEKLEKLRPYFLTVLSTVYRGRVAKDRVIAFLLTEGLKSEAAASFVAEIFERQSVTHAITDKAAYLEAMCAIHSRFPAVALPIMVQSPPVKKHGPKEVADAL